VLTAVVAVLMAVPFAMAQKERNNIYLFDCTESMEKGGLFGPAKDGLDKTITNQTAVAGSQSTVIPFGDEPYAFFSFDSEDYDSYKADIFDTFDKCIKKATTTNISKALKAAFAKCDPKKDNIIYLLTDGQPNGSDSPQKVADLIRKWCNKHTNTRLFYVALKEGVVPEDIRKAIDECNDAYVVQCTGGVIPRISDIDLLQIHTNINELGKNHTLLYSEVFRPLNVSCSDTIFDATIVGGSSDPDGKVNVLLKARNGRDVGQLHQLLQSRIHPGEDYRFTIYITSGDSSYIVANPQVQVFMADHIQSCLSLADEVDELAVDGTSWYDSFLWSKASEPGEVEFDLAPKISGLTHPQTGITLMLVPAEGEPSDYQCYFNGRKLEAEETFVIKWGSEWGSEAKLRVVFNTDAKTGKRYFNLLNRGSQHLDLVNGKPIDEFEGMTLRTEYSVNWNPLKTCLFRIAMAIIAALVLWFFLLRRMFYPTIKVKRIDFAGPGTYYGSKKIKGVRKVVLTSKKQSQNIFSRIFTGEIRFLRAEHFLPEIEILPSGTKKKIRLHSLGKGDNVWDVTPSSILAPFDKATMTNRTTKETSEITVS
jgi:hypothetical protein